MNQYSPQQQRKFAIQQEILRGLSEEQRQLFRRHTDIILIPEDQRTQFGPASLETIRIQAHTLRERFLTAIGQQQQSTHMDPAQPENFDSSSRPVPAGDNAAVNLILQAIQQMQGSAPANRASNLSGIKLVAPDTYHGKRTAQAVETWLHEFHNYCHLRTELMGYPMDEKTKTRYASTLLRGEASEWWRQLVEDPDVFEPNTWEEFCAAFREEFKPTNSEQLAREQLDHLSQQAAGSIRAYIAQFRQCMLELKTMDQSDAIYRFVQGLEDEARMQVLLKDPFSLREAYQFAERYESATNVAHGMRVDRFAQPQSGSRNTMDTTSRAEPMDLDMVYGMNHHHSRNNWQPRGPSGWRQQSFRGGRGDRNSRGGGRGRGRFRNDGSVHNANVVCWHCSQPGHVQRNCPTRTMRINAFFQQLDAHSSRSPMQVHAMPNTPSPQDPVMDDDALFDIATRSIESPIIADNNTSNSAQYSSDVSHVVKEDTHNGGPMVVDQGWESDRSFLERHMLYTSTSETGLPLHRGYIRGQALSILIDSGASANYMSPKWRALADRVTHITSRNVETANGALSPISSRAYVTLDLGGYIEHDLPVYLFESKFDIILGRAWLQAVCPRPDWSTDCWFISHGGQEHVLKPIHDDHKTQANSLLSAKELVKLFKRNEVESCHLLDARQPDHVVSISDPNHSNVVQALVNEFPKVFDSKGLNGLPPMRGIPHVINTGDTPPINRPPYRMSPKELDELRRQLKELLDLGLIEPSTSPWGAPVLFVRKKDGSMRMCIDYRALNKATIRNTCPLPRIDECLERLHGAKFFSSLDLKSGYHQIRLDPADAPKTAMNTRYGKFSWRVLPFGLANSPPVFQAQMNATLGECLDQFAMVYLDDILVFSKTQEEHERHLKHVLDRLQQAQFVVNLKKCHLFQRSVSFLGFKVSEAGTAPDDDKVKAITTWPEPTNVQEVRQFVGTVQHFRRYIPNFAHIASPLTDLTKGTGAKRRPIIWTPACQNSFDRLKHLLTVAPVLQAPCMDRPFKIETDASDFGVGAVLLQQNDKGDWHPLAYESQKLSSEERAYPVQERELLAVLHALRKWRYLVEGRPCVVFTDHEPLQYCRSKPNPCSRIRRWLSELELYQPDIQYQRASKNTVPDALSRLGGPKCTPSPTSFEPDYLYAANLAHDTDWPKFYLQPRNEWPTAYQQLLTQEANHFVVRDQCVYRLMPATTSTPAREVRFALFARRADLVSKYHESCGHGGATTIYDIMHKRWWWPYMQRDITTWIRQCPRCQLAARPDKRTHHAPMRPLDIPEAFSRWHLDFVGELPKTARGNRWLLVAVDYATNWPIAVAMPDATADAIADVLFKEIVMRFGVPQEILTDRGPNFRSRLLAAYVKRLGTFHRFTSAFHPRTNGKCERLNGVIKQMLRKYAHGDIHHWDDYVAPALWACRIRKHRTTGVSPFYLTYGRETKLPGDILHPALLNDLSIDPQAQVDSAMPSLRALKQARATARDRMQEVSQADKLRWDAHLKPHTFKIGDLVLLRHESKLSLEYDWMGPYRVQATHMDTDTYKIVDMNNKPYNSWVHADRLRPVAANTQPTAPWYHPTTARASSTRRLEQDLASPA